MWYGTIMQTHPTKAPPAAKPFLRWAGGKGRLAADLCRRMPRDFETYYEPFVGSGAVFLRLGPPWAVIGDVNEGLIGTYAAVRDNLDDVTHVLGQMEKEYLSAPGMAGREAYYYAIRDEYNQNRGGDVTKCARFLFLNATCFNGVYRENSRGEFNCPFGHMERPLIVKPRALAAAANLLRRTRLESGDFEETVATAGRYDLVYLDPPYDVETGKTGFVAYAQGGFGREEQERLAERFQELSRRGCYVMMSNADTSYIAARYSAWNVARVRVRRGSSADASRRREVHELIVTNF